MKKIELINLLKENENKREKIIEPVMEITSDLMEGLDEAQQIIAALDIVIQILTSFEEEETKVMIEILEMKIKEQLQNG